MKALVTGITGFAGSHLAEHLLDCGDQVLGAGLDARWHASLPEALRRVPLVKWNLADAAQPDDAALAAIEGFAPDVIYHLAALSIPWKCGVRQPTSEAWAANVEGTQRVLQVTARLARRPRVVLVSSSRVYWPSIASYGPLAEHAPARPRTGYGKTKLAAERAARRAVAREGLDVVIARAFQHAGPRQTPELMLAQWGREFALGGDQPVRIYHRDTWIDLSDVRDVVRAYRQLALHGRRGRIYNVGSGIPRRTGTIARRMRELAGSDRPVEYLNTKRRWDPIADVGRLRKIGFRPHVKLDETIADTLADWRSRVAGSTATPQQ